MEKRKLSSYLSTFKNKSRQYSQRYFFGSRLLTHKIRMLPNFIIIGCQRCGTTSLFNYLVKHPCIVGSYVKEIHYFDINYDKRLSWYKAHFPVDRNRFVRFSNKQNIITCEATPYYIMHPHAAKRISTIIPNVKLILLLRNPVDRAYSSYLMRANRGAEKLSFEESIRLEERRLEGEFGKMILSENYDSRHFRKSSYITRGKYIDQIKSWLHYFPKEQFFIETSDVFFENPSNTLKRIYDFLEVPNFDIGEIKVYNKINYKPLDKNIRKYLLKLYKPYNDELSQFLGRKLNWDS